MHDTDGGSKYLKSYEVAYRDVSMWNDRGFVSLSKS